MVLLASSYDQSRYFKAADLKQEKKLRIKTVTEEQIGTGAEKEKKLVVWFTNDERGLVLNKTNNRTIRGAFGDECCFRPQMNSAARWAPLCGCAFRRRSKLRPAMVRRRRSRLMMIRSTSSSSRNSRRRSQASPTS